MTADATHPCKVCGAEADERGIREHSESCSIVGADYVPEADAKLGDPTAQGLLMELADELHKADPDGEIFVMNDDATNDVLSADDRRTIETANDPQNVPASVLTEIIHRLKDKVRGCWDIAASLQERLKAGRERAEQAEAAAAELRKVLDDVQYSFEAECSDGVGECPECHRGLMDALGKPEHHTDDCPIGKALSGDGGTALLQKLQTRENLLAIARKQNRELRAALGMAKTHIHGVHPRHQLWKLIAQTLGEARSLQDQLLDAADANAAGRKDGE